MRARFIVALAVVSAIAASPAAARDRVNAFMGHYGYMMTYPTDYAPNPAFHGVIEVADLYTRACVGLKRMECAKIGMIDFAALPKKFIVAETGARTFKAYVASMLKDAKEAGIKTKVRRETRAGFPAVVIEMPNHPQPLNDLILIEGTKVYYRFKYNHVTGAKAAFAMADSLKEIAPHDDPPPPGAP